MDHETKDRLLQQMRFVVEADKIKAIIRRNRILHGDRHENSAEHIWHLALMAIVLAEYAEPKVDVLRVVKMLLIHPALPGCLTQGETLDEIVENMDDAIRGWLSVQTPESLTTLGVPFTMASEAALVSEGSDRRWPRVRTLELAA